MSSPRMMLFVGACLGLVASLPCQRAMRPLTIVEEFRLSAETHALSALGGVQVSARGLLAVAQGQDGAIRIFSATGAPLATAGRKGAGPGELQGIASWGWWGDTLWVLDGVLSRLSRFDTTGRLLGTQPIPRVLEGGNRKYVQPRVLTVQADGGLLGSVFSREAGASKASLWFVRAASVGGRITAELGPGGSDLCEITGGKSSVMAPLCPPALQAHAFDGSRLAVLTTTMHDRNPAEVRVVMYRGTGGTAYDRVYRIPVAPVTRGGLDTLRQVMKRFPPDAQALLANYRFPSAYPPFLSALVDGDGSLWLRRYRKEEGRVVWYGYAQDGAEVGAVRVHPDAEFLGSERGRIWIIERDADGLESLVRYRIRR